MRKLWSGDFVDFEGKYYRIRHAKLYDLPKVPIPLLVAASGKTMCQAAGRLGDGILTVASIPEFKDFVLPNLARGAREAGRVCRQPFLSVCDSKKAKKGPGVALADRPKVAPWRK